MAKRGRPRKSGPRYGCGKLRDFLDIGHDLTLAHRAELVGEANARDYRAGFPLGILRLRNEIDDAQYQAGQAYASIRGIAGPRGGNADQAIEAWGNAWAALMPSAMTQSQLAAMVADTAPVLSDISDDDRKTRIRRCSKQLREVVAYVLLMHGKLGLEVLDRVTDGEVGPEVYLPRREHQALVGALDRLVVLFKIPRDKK